MCLMKRNKRFMEQIAVAADLEGMPLPGMPIIEISGEHRVLVEHHQGVVSYGDDEICVKVNYGMVRVRGSQLNLSCMTREKLMIIGCIDDVKLMSGGR